MTGRKTMRQKIGYMGVFILTAVLWAALAATGEVNGGAVVGLGGAALIIGAGFTITRRL